MFRRFRTAAVPVLLAIFTAPAGFCHEAVLPSGQPAPPPSTASESAIEADAIRPGGDVPLNVLEMLRGAPKAIYISKSARSLTLLERGKAVRTYPVAIGRVAQGPKQRLGDKRTPEGLYFVAAHHAESRFHKALRISYPNANDADRGLRAGLISRSEAEAIRAAHAARRLPPQGTRLGRFVEIHGGFRLAQPAPGEKPWIYAFTDGCIALTDQMIEAIYNWTPNGAPILIEA